MLTNTTNSIAAKFRSTDSLRSRSPPAPCFSSRLRHTARTTGRLIRACAAPPRSVPASTSSISPAKRPPTSTATSGSAARTASGSGTTPRSSSSSSGHPGRQKTAVVRESVAGLSVAAAPGRQEVARWDPPCSWPARAHVSACAPIRSDSSRTLVGAFEMAGRGSTLTSRSHGGDARTRRPSSREQAAVRASAGESDPSRFAWWEARGRGRVRGVARRVGPGPAGQALVYGYRLAHLRLRRRLAWLAKRAPGQAVG